MGVTRSPSMSRKDNITESRGMRTISPSSYGSMYDSNAALVYNRYTFPTLTLPVRPARCVALAREIQQAWST